MRKTISVSLPVELHALLAHCANISKRSASSLIQEVLQAHLSQGLFTGAPGHTTFVPGTKLSDMGVK